MLSEIWIRARALFLGRRVETEMDEELRFHVEQASAKNRARGMEPVEAARRARAVFGGTDAAREGCREARGVYGLESFGRDLKLGARSWCKTPGFTAVAVLTLALGIGATTALFSAVYGILLRPLPFRDVSQLMLLNETTSRVGDVSVSYPNYLDWKAQSHSFTGMAVISASAHNLSGADRPENVQGYAVSPNLLTVLGTHPLLGRDFVASEAKSGTARVVMLGYGMWRSHFAGDPHVLGHVIQLDGHDSTVIGVLPAEFQTPSPAAFLEPVGVWATGNDDATDRGARGDMVAIARLAPGVRMNQARSEMEGIETRLGRQYPVEDAKYGVDIAPLRASLEGNLRPAMLILFGSVILVLLIACANVANLLLTRGVTRSKEMALRLALGASRGRIVSQSLAEALVLAGLGGAAGLGLAAAGARGLRALVGANLPQGATIALNGMVLAFAAGAALFSALLFGLAPALHASRANLHGDLKEGKGSAGGAPQARRMRSLLAALEIALALVLLAGAGLMTRSLAALVHASPGFQTAGVIEAQVSLRNDAYDKQPAVDAFWRRTLTGVRELPGVAQAAVGTELPLTNGHARTDITFEGLPLPALGAFPHPDTHMVTPGYLATLGIPLLQGRDFTDDDNATSPPVALVNEKLALRFFPGGAAVGRRFVWGRPSATQPPKWVTIVGIVADTKLYGLSQPARLEVYTPVWRGADNGMRIVARAAGGINPNSLLPEIRHVVAGIDPSQPVFNAYTLDELAKQDLALQWVTLDLLAGMSALALVLALIGIYGVMSYATAQRSMEIGIRMALGAQRRNVLNLILGEGLRIAAAGIGIGSLAALALTGFLEKMLYGVSPRDPLTLAGVALLLAAVAVAASYLPARRATRESPMNALRCE